MTRAGAGAGSGEATDSAGGSESGGGTDVGTGPGTHGETGYDTLPGTEPASAQLTISGGGSTQVATDVVFAQMDTLRRLRDEAHGWLERAQRVQALGVAPAPGWRPGDLGACLLAARVAIMAVAERSGELADSLAEAADRYGRLESGLDGVLRLAAAGVAYQLGIVSRLLAPMILLSAAGPAAGVVVGSLLANLALGRPVSVLPPWVADAVRDNPRLLTDPATVVMVRSLVSSADDAGLGVAGLPYPVAAALGDDGAGALGVPTSAFGVLVLARAAGLLRESAVRVHRVGASAGQGGPTGAVAAGNGPRAGAGAGLGAGAGASAGVGAGSTAGPAVTGLFPDPRRRPAGGPIADPPAVPPAPPVAELVPPRPPTGFADLADRIPTEEAGGQVRIERYGDAEHPQWVVYIGGTIDWSASGSTEPWDMASNLAAVADQDAGSYRAVVLALQQAGMQPGDPVVPVAHSQGGLIANELIARGDINAVGLVTFGAPETRLPLPEGLPAIAVEHSDDLVPAVGGATGGDDPRLYVRRELFAEREVPLNETLPAHQLTGYRDTARLIDGSPDPRLLAFREQLGTIVGTTAGEQSIWRGERVP